MGYTSYWSKTETIPQELWDAFITDCKKCYKHLPKHSFSAGNNGTEPLFLSGCSSHKYPVFNKDVVLFNGSSIPASKRQRDKKEPKYWANDPCELDHETFSLRRTYAKDNWDFCKTARKPYDLMVMIVLVLAKYHFGSLFTFSSDGGNEPEYCLHAFEVINQTLGAGVSLEVLIA